MKVRNPWEVHETRIKPRDWGYRLTCINCGVEFRINDCGKKWSYNNGGEWKEWRGESCDELVVREIIE